MAGRIEHVVSHHAAYFDSLDALLAFMAKMLPAANETPPQQDAGLRANV
jgi:hypothetical protein